MCSVYQTFINSNQLFPRGELFASYPIQLPLSVGSQHMCMAGSALTTLLCNWFFCLLSPLNSEKVEKFFQGRNQVLFNSILSIQSVTD